MLDERLIQHPRKFFIDGSWADPSSSAKIDVMNCATEELFETVAEAGDADVERAVSAARKAFDRGPWPRMKHAERAKYLRAIAGELDKRADDLPEIWTTESGVDPRHREGRHRGAWAASTGTTRISPGHVPVRGAAPAGLASGNVGASWCASRSASSPRSCRGTRPAR